ncbi:MAG: hypothetical protein R3B46_00530 [Phycisphaerales bacterium]
MLAAMVIANADRRYYTDAGYNTQIRPSYWGHAVLMAFYAGGAFMLAQSGEVEIGGAVIAAAAVVRVMERVRGGCGSWAAGNGARRCVRCVHRAGGWVFAVCGDRCGRARDGGVVRCTDGAGRVGFLIAGISVLCGVMAAFGWGEAAGGTGSKVMLFVRRGVGIWGC